MNVNKLRWGDSKKHEDWHLKREVAVENEVDTVVFSMYSVFSSLVNKVEVVLGENDENFHGCVIIIRMHAYPYCAVTSFFCVEVLDTTISTTPMQEGSASRVIKYNISLYSKSIKSARSSSS